MLSEGRFVTVTGVLRLRFSNARHKVCHELALPVHDNSWTTGPSATALAQRWPSLVDR